jgi:hypothetical protein
MDEGLRATTFSLERYRDQWGHLPLVLFPFLGAVGIMGVFKALGPRIPEVVATGIIGLVGLGYMVFVLAFPRFWRNWRNQGRLELQVVGEMLQLIDPVTGNSSGACPATAERILPGEFHYSVSSRFAGGTYRAPAFLLLLDGGARISVGVPCSRVTWRGQVERVARPDYSMQPDDWTTFLELLGMSKRLTPVVDARV